MKRRNCESLAKKTGQQCRQRATLWSRYCLFHIEKTPIVISGLVGAVLSLMVTEAVRLAWPSAELRETRILRDAVMPLVDEVRLRHPGLDVREAIGTLTQELRDVRRLASQQEYRPLSNEAVAKLSARLALLSPEGLHVRFVALQGSRPRELLAEELATALAYLGFQTSSAAMTVVYSGESPPDVLVRFGRSDRSAVAAIAGVLSSVLDGEMAFHEERTWDAGYILFLLGGDPLFLENGGVRFR